MRTNKILAMTTVVAMAIALSATFAAAQVRGSKHDLTVATGAAQIKTAATTEVCVFCHTPHGANINVTAPLWNKAQGAGAYQRYSSLGSATLDGQEVVVGSVSLACLSCHDGTQAMDVVLNAPGSGGYNAAGAPIDGGPFTMTGTPIPNLGTDLRNDHPVSIAYAGGACEGVFADCDPSLGGGDPDFNIAQWANINTQNSWWVDTSVGTPNQRDKTDMILYTRTEFTSDGPSVECGSCHDPHKPAVAPAVSFMRIQNSSSDVCLACHIK